MSPLLKDGKPSAFVGSRVQETLNYPGGVVSEAGRCRVSFKP